MTKKAKLIIDGKEIEVEITQEQLDKLCPSKKKTGYERATLVDNTYYGDNGGGFVGDYRDLFPESDGGNNAYRAANYYTSKEVAENNARADKLMRQLRRFAVEHREKELDWVENNCSNKYKIAFDHDEKDMRVDSNQYMQLYGAIYFDTKETAQLAIDTFKDELLWYFKEYKDSL